MAYDAWEREHDTKLVASLKSATYVESKIGYHKDGIQIELAHLIGQVTFCDGVMYWSLLGLGIGGQKSVDQSDIDASAHYLLNYGRKAVRAQLARVAANVIEQAERRLVAA